MRGLAAALILFVLLAAVPWLSGAWGGAYLTSLAIKAMVLAIAAISLDLLIGQGGMVSFGHAAFLGIGSYVAGIGITEGLTDAAAVFALAVLASALFALVTGAICLRTAGVSFIMITLAFGQMVFFTLSALNDYGGDDGLTLWDSMQAYGLLDRPHGLFYAILVVLVLVWAFVTRLSGSRFGRVLRAAKENETRIETLGYGVFGIRLTAYVIAGVIAGVAGVLMAVHAEFISPATASWQRSGDLIIIVVMGGMGTRCGALLGAIAFVVLEESLSILTHDWRLIFGPLLIAIVLFAKGGLASLIGRNA